MASIVTMQRTHIVISQGVAVRAGYIVPFRHLFAINQLAVLLRVQGGWVAFSCRGRAVGRDSVPLTWVVQR